MLEFFLKGAILLQIVMKDATSYFLLLKKNVIMKILFVILLFSMIQCNIIASIITNFQNDILKINQQKTSNIIEKTITVTEDRLESLQNEEVRYSEDDLRNFTELSKKYIGRAEEYDIVTKDGYILKLFRIPGNVKKVVLFCHGNLLTSDNFLIRGNTSLLYMLAKQGFDVWAMNFRGTRYSRRHLTLDPNTDEFWQYSFHEIGIYDYKAVIDFILVKTAQNKLSIAAHSAGASAFFVLTSELPEYNAKVNVFVGLAPDVYLKYSGTPVPPSLILLLKQMKKEEILGYYSDEKKVIDTVCDNGEIGYKLCSELVSSITGFNPDNIEEGFFNTILGHFPAGTSRKNTEHQSQIFRYKDFVKYDYGVFNNLQLYGSPFPPAYDLNKVTVKVALFAAKSDKLVVVKDIEKLRDKLRNVIHYQVVCDDEFNHLDYVWGRNAHDVLYPYVIDILLKYT